MLQTARRRSPARIVLAFAGWDFWRNIRLFESSFFVIVLPALLYLMFGALSGFGDEQAGHGNVAAYTMVSIAYYGAALATSSIAGSAAVERQFGWGRQLSLTGLTNTGYLTGKTLVGLAIAVLPILAVFAAGIITGARMDDGWRWFAAAGLVLVGALPFALYGLATALLFRSEAAVSVASGLLVLFAFFGNVFMPLHGLMLDIARFTPMYGATALARWPLLEGYVVGEAGGMPISDPLWLPVLNLGVWTLIFAAITLVAARRRTSR